MTASRFSNLNASRFLDILSARSIIFPSPTSRNLPTSEGLEVKNSSLRGLEDMSPHRWTCRSQSQCRDA